MKILVLDDGNIGNLVQSLGIAKNFPEKEIVICSLKFKGPKYKLPKRKGNYPILPKFLNLFCFLKIYNIGFLFLKLFLKNNLSLIEYKYDVVINTGSLLSSVNLIISKVKKSKSIQIMLPSFIPLKEFNFLITPYHDYIRVKYKNLKNLIITIGAPNLIDEKLLKEESEKLSRVIGNKNREIIGLLIGGDDQNYKIDKEWIDKILIEIEELKDRFNFLITVSKRTNYQITRYLEKSIHRIKEIKYFEVPYKTSISYYKGILGLSDIIFVSEDSINMISEALTTNKNVFIIGVKRRKNKKLIFDFTIEEIEKKGYGLFIPYKNICQLHKKIYEFKKKETYLNEAKRCVQEILARLN
ncbi:MAG: mitochondrial fission ELM1 family protein [Candidatus Omnitrophica bacterium]|nr:mitochondrial fission ELM1 family protein [Candidatus Omnitrophota bacterium]